MIKFKDAWRNFFGNVSNVPNIFADFIGRDSLKNPYDGDKVVESFAGSTWVYACVREIAENIATVPLIVKNKETLKTVKDSTIGSLLQNVNDISNKFDLIAHIIASLELRGECVIVKNTSGVRNKKVVNMVLKDPSQFKYTLTPDGQKIDYWTYNYVAEDGKTKEYKLDPDNVLFFRYLNPFHPIRGMSPLEAARASILEEFHSKQYNINFFLNDASVSGVLETQGNIQENVFKRLKEEIRREYSGSENSGKMLILEGGLQYKPISLSHKDMQYLETRKITREEICAIFRVPPPVVGIFEYANYANAEQSYVSFWTKTLLPKLKFLEIVFNKFLFEIYEPENFVEFDISEIPVLQTLLNTKMDVAIKMRNVGYPLTIIDSKLNINFLQDYEGELPQEALLPSPLNFNGDTLVNAFKSYKDIAFDNSSLDFVFDQKNKFIKQLQSKDLSKIKTFDLVFDDIVVGDKYRKILQIIAEDLMVKTEDIFSKYIDNIKLLKIDDIEKYIDNVDIFNDYFNDMTIGINSIIIDNYEDLNNLNKLLDDCISAKSEELNKILIYAYKYLFNACVYELMLKNDIYETKWVITDSRKCRNHAHLHNKVAKLADEAFDNGIIFPMSDVDFKGLYDCDCVILPISKKN